ncbi:MAG: glutamate-5-semialdehyde dehydrogenase [Lentisphaeria bacterium]|jgi:glutamate-5-semialdehyde dehydrogenase|nr:glutamate-5-semialdehyde dehydrogenase [Lentisphaeria bacterium]
MTLADQIHAMGLRARAAARALATVSGEARAKALAAMPAALDEARERLREANERDVAEAEQAGLDRPLLERLRITDKVFAYMGKRLREVAALPDPVGRVLEGQVRPTGLRVEKVTVPLGVIGIIYESRPNVTPDAASVCLKSGNAVILRGGSECLRTNLVLAEAMASAATANGLPADAIQIIATPDRAAVGEMIRLEGLIDVLIPRGGKSLIRRIAQESRIPVIKHYDGICHQYLAADADAGMAAAVVVNSKCERVEVCNALETLLLEAAGAARLLPPVVAALRAQGVECRGCPEARAILPDLVPATEEDWATEYLAPILSIRVVPDLPAAVAHINHYGSGHTDGIVTNRLDLADAFVAAVDSASVLVNASTRLSGGGDYGMGAVVGISTDKLHARGPVGPNELTSTKWIARGNGHLRQ